MGTNVRAELFLQDLQQVTFRQIHLQHRRQLVVPHITFGANRHGERDEVVLCCPLVVRQHALEVARLRQRGHFSSKHVDRELHQKAPGVDVY